MVTNGALAREYAHRIARAVAAGEKPSEWELSQFRQLDALPPHQQVKPLARASGTEAPA